MSHTTTLKGVAIKSISAVETAIAKLNSEGINAKLLRDAKPRMYYNDQHGISPYVVALPDGKYDVGLDKQADGSYAPVFDEWGNHVAGQIGATCPMPGTAEDRTQHQIGKFLQYYAEAATIESAVQAGYMVDGAHTDAEGNIHVRLSGM